MGLFNKLLKPRDVMRWRRMLAFLAIGLISLAWFACDTNPQKLIEDLDSNHPDYRVAAAKRLGELKELTAVEPLMKVLGTDDYNKARQAAALALGQIGNSRAKDALCIALTEDEDKEVRLSAAEALGRIKDPAAVPILIRTLKRDKAKNVREQAAEALGRIGGDRATAELLKTLTQVEDLRHSAAGGLGLSGDSKVVAPLIHLLKDNRKEVRMAAAQALGDLKDPRAVGPLVKILDGADYWVESYVSRALQSIGGQKTIGALVSVLPDKDRNKSAARILKELGWEPETMEEKIYYAVATKDGDTIEDMWEETLKVLLKDVESKKAGYIRNAVYAFIGLGRKEAVPLLVDKLNSHGNITTAEVYLNCGHQKLQKAAEDWARQHGYSIVRRPGSRAMKWGSW